MKTLSGGETFLGAVAGAIASGAAFNALQTMRRATADLDAEAPVALLALSDDGAPGYDHENAAALAGLGITAFACTPDAFGDLMAAAIERRDIAAWAQRHPGTPSLS